MEKKVEIFIGGGEELERTGKFINPTVMDLRNWDANLLSRFRAKYYTFIQQCQYCAFGPCDLSKDKRGACGINLNLQMAREALFTAITGASSYITKACELLDAMIKEHTYLAMLNLEDKTFTKFINLLCGYEPKTVGDLKKALKYANEQIVHLLSATHMGQEASDFDFNSKIFHAGMLSLLGMEIYEILRSESKTKFEVGFGTITKNKGIVLIVGDYVPNIAQINNANFEIIHIGSGAFESNFKIGENFTMYEKLGLADVIVIGAGNVRADLIENAKKSGIPVIAVSNRNMAGLADLSDLSADEILKKIINNEISGCCIKEGEKLAVVVEMLVRSRKGLKRGIELINKTCDCINCGSCKKVCPINIDSCLIIRSIDKIFNKPKVTGKEYKTENVKECVKECIECGDCTTNCPSNIQISDLIMAIKEGKELKAKEISILRRCTMCGLCQEKCPKKINIKEIVRIEREKRNIIEDIKFLTKDEILDLLEKCIFCGMCESHCPKQIPMMSIFAEIYKERFVNKKASLTLSQAVIPENKNIILVLGDTNFPNGAKELIEILEEFSNKDFLIFTAGDVAISLAESNLKLVNLGSLSASIHVIEKIIEIAGKCMNKNTVGNFDDVASYIANNIGIVAMFWGGTTQENFAIAQGMMRLGIPVIFGKQGIKYRRELRGDIESNADENDEIIKKISPKNFAFPHLCIAAKTKEEAMLLIPKLVFRKI